MLKSILLILPLVFLCNPLYAYGLLSEQAREQKIREIVKAEAEQARLSYEKKYDECFKASLENPISVEVFKQNKINLTEEEAKYSLIYIYERNFIKCLGDSSSHYLVALDTAKHYGVTDFPKYSVPDLHINIMKYKADYLTIADNKRKLIEKISEMQKLFSLKK